MSIRRFMATAASGLVIALGAGPICALQAQGKPDDLNADIQFIRDVTTGNLLEIRLGQMAQKKATNPAVKQFGAQMVTDHTRLQDQVTAMVRKNGMPYLPGSSQVLEQEVNRLDKFAGAEFDRAYMTSAIQSHENTVSLLQNQGQAAHSAQVRDLVVAALPTVQQHLTMARQIGSQVGATAIAAVPTQPGQVPTQPGQIPTQPGQAPGQVPTQTGQVVTQPGQVTTPNGQVQGDLKADTRFIREVLAGHLLDVRLGQLAQKKATNPAIKLFAQRMVTDHTNLQVQWSTMAAKDAQTSKPSWGPKHQEKLTRLQKLSGNEFDRAYMTTEIQRHDAWVRYFQKEGRAARSAQVRDLVASALPVLEQHLSLAKQAGVQVGADTVTFHARNVSTKR